MEQLVNTLAELQILKLKVKDFIVTLENFQNKAEAIHTKTILNAIIESEKFIDIKKLSTI